jgi:argininosuccinate synthase
VQIGAKGVYIEDLRQDFLSNYILPSIQANGIYENLYLMGTSLGASHWAAAVNFERLARLFPPRHRPIPRPLTPLSRSAARPCISKRAVEIAHREGCQFVAHGATGKGNDQVRFELSFAALDPTIQSIVPWRDPAFYTKFQGRSDLIEYARARGVPVVQTKVRGRRRRGGTEKAAVAPSSAVTAARVRRTSPVTVH